MQQYPNYEDLDRTGDDYGECDFCKFDGVPLYLVSVPNDDDGTDDALLCRECRHREEQAAAEEQRHVEAERQQPLRFNQRTDLFETAKVLAREESLRVRR